MSKRQVLIAGESWTVHSIHQKGFDSFTTTEYAEGVRWLREALEDAGWAVTYQPAHIAAHAFPDTVEALGQYECIIISDVGANTLLLHPDTFTRSQVSPNRLQAVRDYVQAGGGLVMVGGYMTFQGIDGKAQYAGSAIEEALPVTMMRTDDRIEGPQGLKIDIVAGDHPIVAGLGGDWPVLLGYNKLTAKPSATVVATVGSDPLLVAGAFGQGRGVAFASDCGPHWAPPQFVDWTGYKTLWAQIAAWAAGAI